MHSSGAMFTIVWLVKVLNLALLHSSCVQVFVFLLSSSSQLCTIMSTAVAANLLCSAVRDYKILLTMKRKGKELNNTHTDSSTYSLIMHTSLTHTHTHTHITCSLSHTLVFTDRACMPSGQLTLGKCVVFTPPNTPLQTAYYHSSS